MRALLSLILLGACTFNVPVEAFVVPLDTLRLGDTDFAQLIAALESVRFSGKAQLREGQFELSAESYRAMEIEPGTEVEFEALVSLSAETRDGKLIVTPAPRTFRIHFNQPVVLYGRGDSRRVVLNGASLSAEHEGQYDVDVKVGRSLVGTIASAVVGVPSGLEEAPGALDMLARVEVPEVHTAFREGSILRHGESVLRVSEGSSLRLVRIDVDVPAESARMDLEGELNLGDGTCLASDEAKLCVGDVRLVVRGDYSRGTRDGRVFQRLRLSQLDAPSELTSGAGRLEWHDGSRVLDVRRSQLVFRRYECAESDGDADSTCAFEIAAEMETGPGELALQGHALAFESLSVVGARLSSFSPGEEAEAAAEGRVQVERVDITRPRLGTDTASLALNAISVRGLQGSRWSALTVASGSVVASPGAIRFSVGETQLRGTLTGETRIELDQGTPMTLAHTRTEEPSELRVRAEIDGVEIGSADTVIARATGLELDAQLGTEEVGATVRIREDVRIDPSAIADIAMGEVRLGFRAIRLSRNAEGARVLTEGLRLTLPQEQVLENLRLHVPPTVTSDEEALDERVETVLSRALGNPLSGDLSHFRSQLEASRLDELGMSFDRGRLRARGDVDATLRILATETQTHLEQCTHSVTSTMPVPCFEGYTPSICQREIELEVPYPCLRSESADAEVMSTTITVSIDVSGEIRSNAPNTLAGLELAAGIARCDRVHVRGINAALQRALDIEGAVCEHLQSVSRTFALGTLLDVESNPLLGGARVETLDLDSNDTDVILRLDVDVPVP